MLNKNYKTTTTITTKQTINMPVQNHHDRCNELREFILLQGRFPEYTPDDKEERSLYTWMAEHRKLSYTATPKKQQQMENFASIFTLVSGLQN